LHRVQDSFPMFSMHFAVFTVIIVAQSSFLYAVAPDSYTLCLSYIRFP
jgi:hypothetical protein